MRFRLDSFLVRALVLLALALGTLFAAGILWYHAPANWLGRAIVVVAWLAFGIECAVEFVRRRDWRAFAAFVPPFAALLVWFSLIEPSNARDWSPEMARTITYARDGDAVVVSNVRNFHWSGPETADEHWETRRLDLSQLRSVDVLSLYWKGRRIAHTYFSFVWANGEALSLSVEIRKKKGEAYSPIRGFFKSDELAILAGDERDFYGWRIFFPKEDIQLFHTLATPEQTRTLLLKLLEMANDVAKQPVFYNTLTDNCTTEVWMLTDALGHDHPNDWRIMASGYLPEFLYELGILDTSHPLSELRDKGHVLARARDAVEQNLTGPVFSNAIREGVPPVAAP